MSCKCPSSQFSLHGTTLSRKITCLFFSCSKLVLQITNGFASATLSLNRLPRRQLSICKKKSSQRASNSDTSMPAQIYMLFTGREVRMGKTCTRGLEYTRPRAQFFSHTDRPSPVNNIFIFFCTSSF